MSKGIVIKSSLFKDAEVDRFRLELKACIGQQTKEFAVLCAHIAGFNTKPSLPFSMQASLDSALKSAEVTSYDMVLNNERHIAVLISACSYSDANILSRIIRSRLIFDGPYARPHIAVIHVQDQDFDPDVLISDLCSDLRNNIKANSSNIDVKRHHKE